MKQGRKPNPFTTVVAESIEDCFSGDGCRVVVNSPEARKDLHNLRTSSVIRKLQERMGIKLSFKVLGDSSFAIERREEDE